MGEQISEAVAVVFDHEKLDVYAAAREFVRLLNAPLKRISAGLRDQIERSSTSILFNIAEGAGKTTLADKQRYYSIARGSATEAAAQLDVLHIRGAITDAQYRAARVLLGRVVQMLSKMAGITRSF